MRLDGTGNPVGAGSAVPTRETEIRYVDGRLAGIDDRDWILAPLLLVVKEKENFVFNYRASDGRAELLTHVQRSRITVGL